MRHDPGRHRPGAGPGLAAGPGHRARADPGRRVRADPARQRPDLRRRRRDARPVDGGGRAGRRQARRPRHRPRAVRRTAAARRPGRGHAVREAQHRLLPARAAHAGPADPGRDPPHEPGDRGDPGLQPRAGHGRGGPLHELRRLQRLRQLLPRVPGRQRAARRPAERPLLDPHPLLQGLPGLRAGMPDRLPGEGPGDGLRRARRGGADGDRLRPVRRRARRAGAVHPPAHRGRDRRLRRIKIKFKLHPNERGVTP